MSRTTRQRHLWIKYWNFDDPRASFPHGRDGKPCSLLYEDYVKQRGWSRDYHNGPGGRRDRKKSNRRWQRRNARQMLDREEWE